MSAEMETKISRCKFFHDGLCFIYNMRKGCCPSMSGRYCPAKNETNQAKVIITTRGRGSNVAEMQI
jgi:hypothetical protein